MIQISSALDAGNVDVVSADKPGNIRVRIRKDTASDFFQWFYFRVTGVSGENCVIRIENAGQASYARGFKDYKACASYNRDDWFRVNTEYDDDCLTLKIKAEFDSIYFAYFAPYPL